MSLISSLQDPSYIHQKINYDSMKSLDIPAARASFAALYINNIYWGLYMMMENLDSDYLKRECGNDDGTFYKCRHFATLEYLGPDPKTYETYSYDPSAGPTYKLEKKSKLYESWVDFIQLVTALNATDEEFVEQFEQIMDVKRYLRNVVFDAVTCTWWKVKYVICIANHDSYAFNANNYALYHNTKSGLFQYIGYDTDLSWGMDSRPDNVELNVYEYVGNYFHPLVERERNAKPTVSHFFPVQPVDESSCTDDL